MKNETNSRSEFTSAVLAKPGFTKFYCLVAGWAFTDHYLTAHIAVFLLLPCRFDLEEIGTSRTNTILFLRHLLYSLKCNQAPARTCTGIFSLQGNLPMRAGVLSIIFGIFSYIAAQRAFVNYKPHGGLQWKPTGLCKR